LLWGTYSGTKENVISEASNPGVAGNDNDNDDTPTAADQYQNAILKEYRMNVDLTKQKTTGTIGFNFKHALAKVGGSTTHVNTPGSSTKCGFMAVLDLDDMKGNETEGKYTNTGKDGGSQTTKVTINEISVEAYSRIVTATDGSGNPTEWKYLKQNHGTFNLATGQWDILRTVTTTDDNLLVANGKNTPTDDTDDAAATTHIIKPSTDNSTATLATGASAVLAKTLAEPASYSASANTDAYWNEIPAGVTTTKQNVYWDEANPLVFIPGSQAELYVTCDYYVRTYDANLEGLYTQVRQKITKKVTFTQTLELNKMYSLLMHIGLTGVKFTATVSNWDVNTDDPNFDSDEDGTDDIHLDDVYVPINVSELAETFIPTLNSSSDGSGTAHAYTDDFNSDGETIYLTNVTLDYSDDADDCNIPFAEFTAENVNVEVSGATYNTSTGAITIAPNTTEHTKSITITVKRGNTSTDNYQTTSWTMTQKAPKLASINVSSV